MAKQCARFIYKGLHRNSNGAASADVIESMHAAARLRLHLEVGLGSSKHLTAKYSCQKLRSMTSTIGMFSAARVQIDSQTTHTNNSNIPIFRVTGAQVPKANKTKRERLRAKSLGKRLQTTTHG